MKSKQLEEKALREEKVISHFNYNRAEEIISRKKEIDETLLSSIKAKVAVLKDANTPDWYDIFYAKEMIDLSFIAR